MKHIFNELHYELVRKIAEGDVHDLGDISTLADPGIVDDLIETRRGNAAR